jgi:hypothetical protein
MGAMEGMGVSFLLSLQPSRCLSLNKRYHLDTPSLPSSLRALPSFLPHVLKPDRTRLEIVTHKVIPRIILRSPSRTRTSITHRRIHMIQRIPRKQCFPCTKRATNVISIPCKLGLSRHTRRYIYFLSVTCYDITIRAIIRLYVVRSEIVRFYLIDCDECCVVGCYLKLLASQPVP